MRNRFTFYSIMLLSLMIFASDNITKAQQFNINQTLSDGAQRTTIAFDGMAFLTGNFCACSFIPPGKVADYFGFQYLRDNDITQSGHNTDFLTVIANNLLYVLDSTQKAQLVALAIAQVPLINQYGYDRFPLIDAFVRMRDNNIPAGSPGLDKEAIKTYSAQLYRFDGRISFQRAQLYSNIIKALNTSQRNYLDSVAQLGMQNMPVLPLQIDKKPLNNNQFVAVMSFAGDIFSWYTGSLAADVYFCPERQGNYFGGFYIKDAPAMGNSGYSIDTNLTKHGGERFLAALDSTQRFMITSIVDTQRIALNTLVARRTDISNLLRGYLTSNTIDTTLVLNLSEVYGQLDGEISYYYATNFSKVGYTLTNIQRDSLDSIRNLSNYPCNGAYLYSDAIGTPTIGNTDFLFLPAPPCSKPTGMTEVNIKSTTVSLRWNAVPDAYRYIVQYRIAGTTAWTTKYILAPALKKYVTGLLPGTTYQWHMRSSCDVAGTNKSAFTTIRTFTTAASFADNNSKIDLNEPYQPNVFPNPSDKSFTIELIDEQSSDIIVFDVAGNKIEEHKDVSGDFQFGRDLSKGVYMVQIISGGETRSQRIIKL